MASGKPLATNKSLRHKLILLLIFAIGVLLFAILTLVNHRIIGSDDTVFQSQILPYHNVFEWIHYRYFNWSGRVFSEGLLYLLSPAPFYFWQILTTIAYALFAATLYMYYRLFSTTRTIVKDYLMMALALCLPFLMHKAVLSDGAIWMTGSIVYFWMSTLGIIALYPIIYYVIRKKQPHWLITTIGLLAGVVAASSQEQVGALLVGISLIFLIYGYVQRFNKTKIKIPWYLVLFFVVMTASFAVSILAPGNSLRLDLETARWLPDFYTTPLIDKIHYSYRWFLDALINHTGFLLIPSWLSIAALLLVKTKKTILEYVFAASLILISVFSLTKGSEVISYWFEFYATWKPTISNSFVALNLIPWGIALIMTLVAPIVLFRKKIIGLVLTILYGATFATTALMVLSPTLYASSWRTLFVPSVVLAVIVYILFDRILDTYLKYQYLLILVIVSLSLSEYMFQVARLTKG